MMSLRPSIPFVQHGAPILRLVALTWLLAPSAAFAQFANEADFANRCEQPGVVRCVGFDNSSDVSGGDGSNTGVFASSGNPNIFPTLDTAVRASGNSSLKFTIPSRSGADTSGSYFANFSPDLSVQFGENADFYVQWRQRFTAEFAATAYAGGEGWKQTIIGTGDKPGGVLYFSCTDLEVVTVNGYYRGFAQMYNSCSGSASHGAFDGFEEPFGARQHGRMAAVVQPLETRLELNGRGRNACEHPWRESFCLVHARRVPRVRLQTLSRSTTIGACDSDSLLPTAYKMR